VSKQPAIMLASPRGFCAGVERAIAIVDRAIEKLGAPIYVRHEVVHNTFVVNELGEKGAVFVNELDEVPNGSNVIFSAHGVSLSVQQLAADKQLHIFDATCPLVTKVHKQVSRYASKGRDVILIGHAGHPEVEGTLGQYPADATGAIYLVETEKDAQTIAPKHPDTLAYVTQTTLSMDDTASIIAVLKTRFPAIESPKKDDICYATQNRQNAVRDLANSCDLVLIVGSVNSSNSNRLKELAINSGKPSYLIDHADEIEDAWLEGVITVGISSGASAPEVLVQGVIDNLTKRGMQLVREEARSIETVKFPIPIELA
jgi:4-hydroxy-3-methylbut-2-en-1-yl diphosphate reductase